MKINLTKLVQNAIESSLNSTITLSTIEIISSCSIKAPSQTRGAFLGEHTNKPCLRYQAGNQPHGKNQNNQDNNPFHNRINEQGKMLHTKSKGHQ